MPKVSVIMPAYNVEKYIAEAIESILNQTFKDFEFIILNDGSTDNTPKIIAEYAKKDKRIKFIDNQKNQGFISSLNECLNAACGEYIAKMDSDDISLPTRLEKQVAYLDNHQEVGLVGAGYKAFDKVDFEIIHPKRVGTVDLLNGCCTTIFMLRKKIIEQNRLRFREEFLHAEDYDFYTQFIKYASIHNLQEVLYLYRWHGDNASIKQYKIQNENSEKIRKNLCDFLSGDNCIQEKLLHLFNEKKHTEKKNVYFLGIKLLKIVKKKDVKNFYLFGFIPVIKVKEKK